MQSEIMLIAWLAILVTASASCSNQLCNYNGMCKTVGGSFECKCKRDPQGNEWAGTACDVATCSAFGFCSFRGSCVTQVSKLGHPKQQYCVCDPPWGDTNCSAIMDPTPPTRTTTRPPTTIKTAKAKTSTTATTATTTTKTRKSNQQSLNWPSPAISWFYDQYPYNDDSWRYMLADLEPYFDVVTSMSLYCGPAVANNGSIATPVSNMTQTNGIWNVCFSNGNGIIPMLISRGILIELVLDSGNCLISAFRTLWNDSTTAATQMINMAKDVGASGWVLDLEPLTQDCSGKPSGTAADAVSYSKWLTAIRTQLNNAGLRLTVYVANWSPVLDQYSILAPCVDRILTGSTYDSTSFGLWQYYFNMIQTSNVVIGTGTGIGAAQYNGTWDFTVASAQERVIQALHSGVTEMSMFKLSPTNSYPPIALPTSQSRWYAAAQLFLNPTTRTTPSTTPTSNVTCACSNCPSIIAANFTDTCTWWSSQVWTGRWGTAEVIQNSSKGSCIVASTRNCSDTTGLQSDAAICNSFCESRYLGCDNGNYSGVGLLTCTTL